MGMDEGRAMRTSCTVRCTGTERVPVPVHRWQVVPPESRQRHHDKADETDDHQGQEHNSRSSPQTNSSTLSRQVVAQHWSSRALPHARRASVCASAENCRDVGREGDVLLRDGRSQTYLNKCASMPSCVPGSMPPTRTMAISKTHQVARRPIRSREGHTFTEHQGICRATERAHIERALRGALGPNAKPKQVLTLSNFIEEIWWPKYRLGGERRGVNSATTVMEKEYHMRVHILPGLGLLRLNQIGIRTGRQALAKTSGVARPCARVVSDVGWFEFPR
jgi:hypothetical protein